MNKKIYKILLTVATFFIMSESVFGANIILDNIKDDNEQKIYININGKSEEQLLIKISDGKDYIGYSIDVGANLTNNTNIATYGKTLPEYLNESLNDLKKSTEVAKKINQYIHFGYQYNGQDNYKYLLATQKLIWDELYNAGYRQSNYSNDAYFSVAEDQIDISSEISIIKKNINNYYKTPSMCSSTTKLEIAVGETAIYEDSVNVLSSYKVNCDEGLSCKIEDNKLKVTVEKEGAEQKVTFIKDKTPNPNVIYKNEKQAAVLTNNGELEGISCQLGIDTYKNVQTAGIKIAYLTVIGLFCGVIAYISYYTKKSLKGPK